MKRVLLVVLVLFLGYWMVQAPNSFASFVQDGASWTWSIVSSLFRSLIDVLDSFGH